MAKLFKSGELDRALKQCRVNNWDVEEFRPELDQGAKRLVLGHQPGKLLSFMHKHGIACGYTPLSLLKKVAELGDYPGLLKQAERFRLIEGLEEEIDWAIARHEEKGLIAQAVAWRRKFAELHPRWQTQVKASTSSRTSR